MRLVALEIPDEPAEVPGWLERHLVGLDLAALVAELEAVHGPTRDVVSPVRDVLGDRLDAVLADGLAALPPQALGQLLRRPRLLFGLQEVVLTSGGDHWRRAGLLAGDIAVRVEHGRERLESFLQDEGRAAAAGPGLGLTSRPVAWYRRPWIVSLATAATVLLAVTVSQRLLSPSPGTIPLSSPGWGWNQPGALPQDVPPSAYLDRLADAAEEWYRTRPDEPIALARRIGEFRQGCSVLILVEHRPLSAEDRRWLVEKCRAWAAKLEEHLEAVEAGVDPRAVRAGADQTVDKLRAALRERARSLS